MPIAARDVPSPFKFLDAYTKKDGDIFFGRDAEIEQLYQSVNKNRIVLVYGQSGTGKTSLVQCGLSNRFEVTDWVPFWIRRGKNINESLHQVLSQSKALGGAVVDQDNLFHSLERLSKRYVRPIYLLFDQFEELLLLGEESEKQQFLTTIKGILSHESTESCHLLFIIREEYFGWLESFESAIPGFSDRRLRVEPMRPDRLDEVIIQSCAAFNIELENPKENTRQIRHSLRTKGGIALPYLQVYLDLLYREDYLRSYPDGWSGSGYAPMHFETREIENMGAITDIMERLLTERREAIQQELSGQFPDLPVNFVEQVLDSFVTFEGTKRPISCVRTVQGIVLGEKAPAPLRSLPKDQLSACLEALENNRLLRADEDTFELAHDSLAALIDRQRSDEQRRVNEVFRQIRNSRQIYEETGTDFLSRNQLALYETYLPQLELDADLQDFLEKSRQHLRSIEEADREKLIEERRLRESAETNARQAKFRARLAIVLTILALGAALWAGTLLVQTRKAKDDLAAQAKASEAAALAAKSRKVFYDNHNVAWQLAARAYDLLPTPETALALRDMTYALRPARELISGHTQQVYNLQFSRDGRYRMSAAADNTLRVTNTDGSGSTLICLDDKSGSAAKFSADGRYAVVVSGKTVQVWDLQKRSITWQKAYTAPSDTRHVGEVAITADGTKIGIAYFDRVDIYDWSQEGSIQRIQQNSMLADLAFSPDGNFLAAVGSKGSPILWDLDGNRKVTYQSNSAARVTKIVFSPDGKFLAGGEEYGQIRVWSVEGQLIKTLEGYGRQITALAFSPDSRQILAGDVGGVLMRWYVDYFSRVNTILVEKDMLLLSVAFSPDGRQFMAPDRQGNLLAWPIALEKAFLRDPLSEISSVLYLDSSRFIVGDGQGKLRMVSDQGMPQLLYEAEDEQIWSIALSPDRKTLAAATNLGNIYLVSLEKSEAVNRLEVGDSGITHLEYTPDGRHLLISNLQDGNARLISLNGQVIHTFSGPDDQDIVVAVLSPDGSMVFAPSSDGTSILTQLDGTVLHRGFQHQDYVSGSDSTDFIYAGSNVNTAIFTADGRQLITGEEFGMIQIWDLAGGEIRRFGDKESQIIALALSPDGKFLAAGTEEGSHLVNLWSMEGKLVQSFEVYAAAKNLTFSPDGKYLLCAGENGIPELLPLWNTVLETPAVSLIDLHRYGGIGEEQGVAPFLAGDSQTDLAACAAYFAGLYQEQKQELYLDYSRQLYEKALSPEFQSRPDALTRDWWLRELQTIPGNAPELVRLREVYGGLRERL